jgi:transposase
MSIQPLLRVPHVRVIDAIPESFVIKECRTGDPDNAELGRRLHVSAEYDGPTPVCCDAPMHQHDTRERALAHTPIEGMPVILHVGYQRHRCAVCRKVKAPELTFIHGKHRVTCALAWTVFAQACDLSFADVGRLNDLSSDVVRALFLEQARLADRVQPRAPRYLGIDEVHLSARPRAVFTDLERGTVVEVLESYSVTAVVAGIQSLAGWERIEAVAMDFAKSYATAIRKAYAGQPRRPTIVIDKRHVLELSRARLEKARIDEKEAFARGERREIKQLINMRAEDMTSWHRRRLAEIAERYPRLGAAHQVHTRFRAIYEAPDRSTAQAAFADWSASFPVGLEMDFRPVANTVRDRADAVFAYFDLRITNAVTEARNRCLKELWRRARGYRKTKDGFAAFRLQALHKLGDRRPSNVAIARAAQHMRSMTTGLSSAEIVERLETPARARARWSLGTIHLDAADAGPDGVEVIDDLPPEPDRDDEAA